MITFQIKGFPVKVGRKTDLYDGLAKIEPTGPDYKEERFVVLSYQMGRRRDRAKLPDDMHEVAIAHWLHGDPKVCAEICALLGI